VRIGRMEQETVVSGGSFAVEQGQLASRQAVADGAGRAAQRRGEWNSSCAEGAPGQHLAARRSASMCTQFYLLAVANCAVAWCECSARVERSSIGFIGHSC
jgi:hypothetical protein